MGGGDPRVLTVLYFSYYHSVTKCFQVQKQVNSEVNFEDVNVDLKRFWNQVMQLVVGNV